MEKNIELFPLLIVIALFGCLIGVIAGQYSYERRTNDNLQYIKTHKSETTQTLIQGINLIMSGNNPKQIDQVLNNGSQ